MQAAAEARKVPPDEALTDGFDSVFLAWYPTLVRLAARITANRADAEEIASDALLKLARSSLFSRPGQNTGGWLYRTVTRAALDRLRASRARLRHNAKPADARHAGGDALEEMLARERRARVRTVLASLRRRDAELLLLRSEGLSYSDVAAAVRVSPSSVGTLLARAQSAFEREYVRRFGGELK